MLEKAMEKLNAEIAGNSDRYIQMLGELVKAHIEKNPELAEVILVEGKTLVKAMEYIKNEARKQAKGGVAILSDVEALEISLKYFNQKSVPKKAEVVETEKESSKKKPEPEPECDLPDADEVDETEEAEGIEEEAADDPDEDLDDWLS